MVEVTDRMYMVMCMRVEAIGVEIMWWYFEVTMYMMLCLVKQGIAVDRTHDMGKSEQHFPDSEWKISGPSTDHPVENSWW